MPNSNKDTDLDRGYDSDKPVKNSGSDRNNRYNRDSLDNYNDNLSKRAVGSIFNNIEFDNSEDFNNTQNESYDEDFTIDTNFSIKSNTQRKQVVSDFFADDNVAPKRKPKNARPTRLNESTPAPISSKKQLTNNNSAFTSDDDTLYNKKYVTRGNHMAVTPAMAAKRKNKTMMESQRIPTVTDEEIAAYKSSITLANATPYETSSTQNTNTSKHTHSIPATNTSSHTSYITSNIKSSVPRKENNSEDYDNSITMEQKEIYDYLQSEIQRKNLDIENTMHRINEKTKHYNEIIESTNKKYTPASNNFTLSDDSHTDNLHKFEQKPTFVDSSFEEEFQTASSKFSNNTNFDLDDNTSNENNDFSDLDISVDDLDQDFEDTIASNYSYQEKTSRQSRPLIPTNNLSENKPIRPTARRGNDSLIQDQETGNFYDLESNTYVTQKTKFNTGEVTLINDTVATEISLEDLDELVFDNYDTTDMEFLRRAIKEKSQARKMQVIDEQFSEFEKKHRDFGNKNVPPRTSPRPKPNKKPETTTSEQETAPNTGRVTTQRQRPEPRQEQEYNSYEYRKSHDSHHSEDDDDINTSSHSGRHNTVDTGRHTTNHNTSRHNIENTGRYNSDHTGRHNIEHTGRYNTSHTGRIPPTHTSRISTVDLDNDYDDYDDYSKRYSISLGINILFGVALAGICIFTFLKVSSLSDEVAALSVANAELVEQNNKINELQIDVDYYKDLYQNTEEGQASLEAEKNGETSTETETEGSKDSTSTNSSSSTSSSNTSNATGTTYTVQSGDTLSSISKKMYGTSNEYKKIMDANNLTSENVSIGQVLIIP